MQLSDIFANSSPLTDDPTDPTASLMMENPTPAATTALMSSDPGGSSAPGGLLTSIETFASDAFHGIGNAAKDIVEVSYSGVKTVVSDSASGVEHVVSFGTGQVFLLLLGAGALIYVAGKAGVFKAVVKAL